MQKRKRSGWHLLAESYNLRSLLIYFDDREDYAIVTKLGSFGVFNFKVNRKDGHLEIVQVAEGEKKTNKKLFEKIE